MRYAGEQLVVPPGRQDEVQFKSWMQERERGNPIQVVPRALPDAGVMTPWAPVPEFDHPLMNPLRGPSLREKWQFERLLDEQAPFPLT
jgi:hypothetical protein